MPESYNHALLQTHMIPHTKTPQPIYQGIRFKPPCNIQHNFLWTIPFTKCIAECQHTPHDIMRFYKTKQFYIGRHFLCQHTTHARKYCPGQNNNSIHWYTHTRLTRHIPLQNTIQINIWVEKFPFLVLYG